MIQIVGQIIQKVDHQGSVPCYQQNSTRQNFALVYTDRKTCGKSPSYLARMSLDTLKWPPRGRVYFGSLCDIAGAGFLLVSSK